MFSSELKPPPALGFTHCTPDPVDDNTCPVVPTPPLAVTVPVSTTDDNVLFVSVSVVALPTSVSVADRKSVV